MSTLPDELLKKLQACDARIKTTSPQQGSLLHVRVKTAALKQAAMLLRDSRKPLGINVSPALLGPE